MPSSQYPCEVRATLKPNLQIRKLELQDMKKIAYGHAVRQQESRDSHLWSLLTSKSLVSWLPCHLFSPGPPLGCQGTVDPPLLSEPLPLTPALGTAGVGPNLGQVLGSRFPPPRETLLVKTNLPPATSRDKILASGSHPSSHRGPPPLIATSYSRA